MDEQKKTSTRQGQEKKRQYQKPEIREVKMVVDEALAPGCKSPAQNGPTSVGTSCLAPTCFSNGS